MHKLRLEKAHCRYQPVLVRVSWTGTPRGGGELEPPRDWWLAEGHPPPLYDFGMTVEPARGTSSTADQSRTAPPGSASDQAVRPDVAIPGL